MPVMWRTNDIELPGCEQKTALRSYSVKALWNGRRGEPSNIVRAMPFDQVNERKDAMSYGQCPKCHEKFYSSIQSSEHVCMSPTESYLLSYYRRFEGIPVSVDPQLKGNEHYLCISQDLLAELEKQKG